MTFFFQDKREVSATDVRIVVAMTLGKTLDELTLEDYEQQQKAWISAMVRMLPATYMRKQSHHLQAILRILNKEILKPMRLAKQKQKRKPGRPRKNPN